MSAPVVGSPEWQRIVTASKMSAIIGVSPWESPYSCWMTMKGLAPKRETSAAMSRGHYLEPAILAWWRDQYDIDKFPGDTEDYAEQVWAAHEDWAGCTVDAAYTSDDGYCIVEAKSAARMDEWGREGTDEIPAYYLTQVYFQLAVTGAERCHVPVIGPFLDFSEYVVEADEAIQADLLDRARVFYDSLAGDVPPALDASVATYDVVRRLHPDIDKGACVELDFDDAVLYLTAVREIKQAEADDRAQKSALLNRMGRAQYATYQGATIARRQPNRYGVSLVPVATLSTLDNLDTQESA